MPDGALLCYAACNISLYYYAGFCYLLLRRYTDAARSFNIILNYISRHATCSIRIAPSQMLSTRTML